MYVASRVERSKEVRPQARIENLLSLYSRAHVLDNTFHKTLHAHVNIKNMI